MPYYDGFVIAVPTANKDAFVRHASTIDPIFLEHGASRVVECWADDVKHGKVTDFYGAVQATGEESVAFSWIEWPDKTTRDKGMAAVMDPAADARSDPARNPMPFDGARMIYGGFTPLVIEGDHSAVPYVQGFIVPVPFAKREDYAKMAGDAWGMFRDHGALAVLEAWGDDVPHGTLTDFYRAGKATQDEGVVFSYLLWPSREACQEAQRKMEAEMRPPKDMEMPFDPMRMVYGGFVPVLDLTA